MRDLGFGAIKGAPRNQSDCLEVDNKNAELDKGFTFTPMPGFRSPIRVVQFSNNR